MPSPVISDAYAVRLTYQGDNYLWRSIEREVFFWDAYEAAQYCAAVMKWSDAWYPTCCIGGVGSACAVKVRVVCNDALVQSICGRTWDPDIAEAKMRKFREWLHGGRPGGVDGLAHRLQWDLFTEGRVRCCPCLHTWVRCLLCCLVPASVPKCW